MATGVPRIRRDGDDYSRNRTVRTASTITRDLSMTMPRPLLVVPTQNRTRGTDQVPLCAFTSRTLYRSLPLPILPYESEIEYGYSTSASRALRYRLPNEDNIRVCGFVPKEVVYGRDTVAGSRLPSLQCSVDSAATDGIGLRAGQRGSGRRHRATDRTSSTAGPQRPGRARAARTDQEIYRCQ